MGPQDTTASQHRKPHSKRRNHPSLLLFYTLKTQPTTLPNHYSVPNAAATIKCTTFKNMFTVTPSLSRKVLELSDWLFLSSPKPHSYFWIPSIDLRNLCKVLWCLCVWKMNKNISVFELRWDAVGSVRAWEGWKRRFVCVYDVAIQPTTSKVKKFIASSEREMIICWRFWMLGIMPIGNISYSNQFMFILIWPTYLSEQLSLPFCHLGV